MWLANVEDIWRHLPPAEAMRGTDLALRLLQRTRDLLGDGLYWQSRALAVTWEGAACDPLAKRAHSFSLAGAAARARWEMREELADAEISPAHMREVMQALFSVARDYRGEGGWNFVCAVLDGMETALEDYRNQQLAELRRGECGETSFASACI